MQGKLFAAASKMSVQDNVKIGFSTGAQVACAASGFASERVWEWLSTLIEVNQSFLLRRRIRCLILLVN